MAKQQQRNASDANYTTQIRVNWFNATSSVSIKWFKLLKGKHSGVERATLRYAK